MDDIIDIFDEDLIIIGYEDRDYVIGDEYPDERSDNEYV